MTFILAVLAFCLGAVFASFAGVLAGRLATGQSFMTGRSRCDACDAPLSSYVLAPVLSYAFSGGRSSCCGARLSFLMPLSELLLGGLFALSYLRFGLSLELGFLWLSFVLLFALTLYDLAHQILPPRLLGSFLLASASFALLIAGSSSEFLRVLVPALLASSFLAAIHFLSSGRAMGLADAPLVFGLALIAGPSLTLSGLIYSFWIGGLIGIVLLVGRPAGSRMGIEVPFAPFLAAGFLLAFVTQWNLLALIGAA